MSDEFEATGDPAALDPRVLYAEQQCQNNSGFGPIQPPIRKPAGVMSAQYRQNQQAAEPYPQPNDDAVQAMLDGRPGQIIDTGYDPSAMHMRLACLQLAIPPDDGRQKDDADILRRAQRFWRFVEFGEVETELEPKGFDLRLNRE